VSGILLTAVLAGAAKLVSNITVGNDASTRRGYSAPNVATAPGFGAMAPVTFLDRSNISRTIGALYWRSTASEIVLAFPTGSPPDSDATFTTLTIGARVLQRAARSSYGAWGGPGVAWGWVGIPDPFSANGTGTNVKIS
jgi:hypothetical protein